MIPPLAIIQVRLHSTRLPRKMLLDVGGHPLIWWAWDAALARFGKQNVVIAVPESCAQEFRDALPVATVFPVGGDENDVLRRLWLVAGAFRVGSWDTPIHRITPDDWPPVLDRDVTTLRQLAEWNATVTDPYLREHVGYLFHPDAPQEINTLEDLEAVRRSLGTQRGD